MVGTVGKNGILLNENPTPKDIADSLQYMIELPNESAITMHKSAIEIWNKRFDALENAKAFSAFIEGLCKMGTKRVILVTDGYPFGGERSFIQSELKELLNHVDVTVVPFLEDDNRNNQVDYGFETDELKNKLDLVPCFLKWSVVKAIPFFFLYFFDYDIRKERREVFGSDKGLVTLFESVKYYSWAKRFERWMNNHIDISDDNTVLYTYWYRYTTLGICLNSSLKKYDVITRTHGYDLYDYRVMKSKRQPFRRVMEERLRNVVFACNAARDYYLHRYNLPDDHEKYFVSYIGTEGNYTELLNKSYADEKKSSFKIVSCSNLIELKRVDLIIDAIFDVAKRMEGLQIEWVHFGDGPMHKALVGRIENGIIENKLRNLSYSFMGNVDNNSIHDYYRSNRVDCFITVSSSEGGCPVSIQEAMAYGIPVIGTNVGGIPEAIECLVK